VLPVGEASPSWELDLFGASSPQLICQYRNLWGDKYEVRARIERPPPPCTEAWLLGREEFRVVETA
jgi:hypothetical protein